MNKQLKIIICIVMISAIAMIFICGMNYSGLGKELRSLDRQLTESREKWEKIAAEKEALQVDLNENQKKLKSMQRTLDDKTKEAEEIRAEIEQLRSEIDTLKQDSPAAQ